jgi:tRNA dimethylallyltransferase
MEEGKILVVSGPTASGKTELALRLGLALPLEIVGADSLQVYRGMDIGTAKPSPAERRLVPHHLVDVADPLEEYNAGRYVREAEEAVAGIRRRGRFPLVVGGTGMYIRALLKGLDPLPSDAAVRAVLARRWEEEGGAALHAELVRIDPGAAERIHAKDRPRLLRALEVFALTGVTPSSQRRRWAREGGGAVLFLVVTRERAELYRRIDARVDEMFRKGFVDEVLGLLSRGVGPDRKPMGALGYRHIAAHLLQGVPLDRTIAETKRDTRRYAKRQLTWLSGEEGTVRLEGEGAMETALHLAKKFLF